MALLPVVTWGDDSGAINGISWFYEESTSTLTLSGAGNMPDFYYVARPWDAYRNNIRKVVIGDSITSIGPRAFYGYGIESIVGGENLTLIGKYAFYGCSRLSSVPIWPNVRSFGNFAFSDCRGLKSIPLGPKVYELGEYVFSGTKIKSINIPGSLYVVSYKGFSGCAIDTVYIEDLRKWCNIFFITDRVLSSDNPLSQATHVFVEGEEVKEWNLVIPDEVTTIESNTFQGCQLLSTLTTGDGVTRIGAAAFYNTPLSTVILGKNITNIDCRAFSGCSNLKDVYVYAESVPSAYSMGNDDIESAFDNDLSTVTLHVPASAIEAYKAQSPWNNFGHIYAIGEEPLPQCATPTISFTNGKIKFACETEDVEYVPTVTCTPSQTLTGDELELGTTYTVSVYAKREGYLDSEVATSTITLSTVGDVNGDGKLTIADVTSLVNAILGK